jgi:hypothetical protein
MLFPVVKRQCEELALGYVTARIYEGDVGILSDWAQARFLCPNRQESPANEPDPGLPLGSR